MPVTTVNPNASQDGKVVASNAIKVVIPAAGQSVQTTQTVKPAIAAPAKDASQAGAVAKPAAVPAQIDKGKQGLAKVSADLQAKNELADLRKKAAQFDSLKERASKDALSVLSELGTDWDSIAAQKMRVAKDPTGAKLAELEEKLTNVEKNAEKKIEDAQNAAKTQQEQAQTQEFERVANEMAERIHTAADKYPMTAAFKNGKQVSVEIINHFEKTGKMLSEDEAAQQLETRTQEESLNLVAALPKAMQEKMLAKLNELVAPQRGARPHPAQQAPRPPTVTSPPRQSAVPEQPRGTWMPKYLQNDVNIVSEFRARRDADKT